MDRRCVFGATFFNVLGAFYCQSPQESPKLRPFFGIRHFHTAPSSARGPNEPLEVSRHVCLLHRTRLTTVHRPGWTVHTQFSHGECTRAPIHALRTPWLYCRGFLFVEYVHTMSAQKLSRAYAQGELKKLRRMKAPLVLKLEVSAPPRNPVAVALAQRSLSSAAGKHIRTRGAQRRADNVALRKAIQSPFSND